MRSWKTDPDIRKSCTFRLATTGDRLRFVSDPIESQEMRNALAAVLRNGLPLLGFEVPEGVDSGADPKLEVTVRSPVRRTWQETALVLEDVLDADATIRVDLAKQTQYLTWKQDGVEAKLTAGQLPQFKVEGSAVVTGRSTEPAVELAIHVVDWQDDEDVVSVAAACSFQNCPPFDQSATVAVAASPIGATVDAAYARTDDVSRITAAIPLQGQRPGSLELTCTWPIPTNTSPLISKLSVHIPTAFYDPQFSTADEPFVPQIYVGCPPTHVSFGEYSYLPAQMTLAFSFRTQSVSCPVTFERIEQQRARYRIEWPVDGHLEFKRAVPGPVSVSVDFQPPAGGVALVPRSIAGWWTLSNDQPAFRLLSRALPETTITHAEGADPSQRAEVTATAALLKMRETVSLPFVTRFVMGSDGAVPIEDGRFRPLYPRDPRFLWALPTGRVNLVGATEALASPRVLTTEGDRPFALALESKSISAQIAGDLTQQAVIEFNDGKYQLLVSQHVGARHFGQALDPRWNPPTTEFGMFFRGFYLIVHLEDLKATPLLDAGKLLLIDEPLRLGEGGALKFHLTAFHPLRATCSPDTGALIVMDGTNMLEFERDDEGLLVDGRSPKAYGRLGYLFDIGQNGERGWTSAPPTVAPWAYTFDHLVFTLDSSNGVLWHGWFLPKGAARIHSHPPFAPYRLDFTGAPAGVAALEAHPLRFKSWESPVDVDEEALDAIRLAIDGELTGIGVRNGSMQQLETSRFSIGPLDGQTYDVHLRLRTDPAQLQAIVAVPFRQPDVAFFELESGQR